MTAADESRPALNEFLAGAAIRMIEIGQEAELCQFLGEQAARLAPEAVVAVAVRDEAAGGLTLRAIYTAGELAGSGPCRLSANRDGIPLPKFPLAQDSPAGSGIARFLQPWDAWVEPGAAGELSPELKSALAGRETVVLRLDGDGAGLGGLLLAVRPGTQLGETDALRTLVNLGAAALGRLFAKERLFAEGRSFAEGRRHAQGRRQPPGEDYRSVLEHTRDAVIVLDPDSFTILEGNSLAAGIYGFSPDEFAGMPLEGIAGDAAHIKSRLQEVLTTGRRVDFEAVHYRKDGKELFLQVSCAPSEVQGRPAVVCLLRDFTARKLAEVQVELNARRLAVMSRMGQIVTSSLELGEVLQRVTREAQALMGVDTISILLKENEAELTFIAVSDENAPDLRSTRIPIHAGAAGRVMQTGEPVFITQEAEQGLIYRAVDTLTGFHTRSLLAVPLALNNRIIGVVEAVHHKLGAFTRDDLHTLEGVASWAAIAIANARQYATLQQRLHENEAIADIGRSLLGTLDLQQVLQMIVDAAQQLIPDVERAVIHLVDDRAQTLEMAAATGFTQLEGPFFTIRPGQGVAGKVLAEGKTVNVADTRTDPSYLPLGSQAQAGSLLVAPIQSGASLLGTLSVRSTSIQAFSTDDERLLTTLGVQAALAIQNARLFEAEQRSRQVAELSLQQEKATRAQLVQSEKLAALGRIVASVAHELNNPLQAIQNALYLVQLDETLAPQAQEDLRVVLTETNRMAELIARLRETYRPAGREEFHPEALDKLVEEVQRLLETHMRHRGIQFDFSPDDGLPPVPVIRDQLRQVILNLSLNAIESMGAGGRLTVRAGYHPERRQVVLAFTDTGPGIPAAVLPNLFEPFFTTKETGTGLGLAISYDIVQRHQGRIEVDSSPGSGSTFRVWLPAG